jgi:hypothetical protein
MILPLIYLSLFVFWFVMAQNLYEDLLNLEDVRSNLLRFTFCVVISTISAVLFVLDTFNLYEHLNWFSIKINLL